MEQDCWRIRFIRFHQSFPETFAAVKISFCIIPSLRVALTASGFHRVAHPLALCKVETLHVQNQERRVIGGGIGAEISEAGEGTLGSVQIMEEKFE